MGEVGEFLLERAVVTARRARNGRMATDGDAKNGDPVYYFEDETDSEEDSEESIDWEQVQDEENVMGADFKLSGWYGQLGLGVSGIFMFCLMQICSAFVRVLVFGGFHHCGREFKAIT